MPSFELPMRGARNEPPKKPSLLARARASLSRSKQQPERPRPRRSVLIGGAPKTPSARGLINPNYTRRAMCQCRCLRRLLVGAGLANPSKEDDAELLNEIDVTTEEGSERFLERFELPDCHNPRDLTGDDRQRLLRLFDFFDLDKELHISKRELRIGLSALGQPPTDSDAKRMISQLDLSRGRSGDGQVDFEEFCLGLLHRRCDLYLALYEPDKKRCNGTPVTASDLDKIRSKDKGGKETAADSRKRLSAVISAYTGRPDSAFV